MGDFMPSVVWIGDRASSVVVKSVPLLDVTCLSVSMSLLISGLWGFSDQARTLYYTHVYTTPSILSAS